MVAAIWDLSWDCGLKHLHVASPCALGFFTTKWLMWKWIKENLIQSGAGKPWRRTSHADTTRCSLLYKYGQKEAYFTTPAGRWRIFSLPSNSPANEKPTHSANKKPWPPWTLNLLQWTFAHNCCSQLPPFPLQNNARFLCFLDLPMVHHSLHVLPAIPLLFPNKLIFAGKITGYYFFRLTLRKTDGDSKRATHTNESCSLFMT